MRTNIWIPKDIKPEIVKAAKKATDSGGVGAYLIKLHKESKAAKNEN